MMLGSLLRSVKSLFSISNEAANPPLWRRNDRHQGRARPRTRGAARPPGFKARTRPFSALNSYGRDRQRLIRAQLGLAAFLQRRKDKWLADYRPDLWHAYMGRGQYVADLHRDLDRREAQRATPKRLEP